MNRNRSAALRNDGSSAATQTVYQNWRENFVRPMLIGATILGLVALVPALFSTQSFLSSAVFIAAYMVLLVVAIFEFPYWLRMGVFVLLVYVLGLVELFATGILGDGIFFFLAFIVITTMMFSPRAGAVAVGLSLLTYAIVAVLTLNGVVGFLNAEVLPAKPTDWLSSAATTILFGGIIILGLRQLQSEFLNSQKQTVSALGQLEAERGSLEERIGERTVQLKAVNEVGRVASGILDPEELIARVVNLITDQFGYYYSAIFLVDEKREWAELHNATGEAGRVLRENKHRLRIGGNSMVGTAISTGQSRISQNVGAEPVRFENPLLPYTRSEIALPLVAGDTILGALDVQSTQEAAFGQQEIETLQSMVNQVAIAFENARLFQSAQQNLDEMRAVQRQYVTNSWNPLSGSRELRYQVGDDEVSADSVELKVPLALRDEIIGQISLSSEDEWSPEQKNLIEAIATQATLALENARLVEDSQSAAAREHLLADITGKVWASTTIEGILQSAVRELGRALDASEVSIELRMDDQDE
jgi:GAF domain-containing protein